MLTCGLIIPGFFFAFDPVSGLMPKKDLWTISKDNNFQFYKDVSIASFIQGKCSGAPFPLSNTKEIN